MNKLLRELADSQPDSRAVEQFLRCHSFPLVDPQGVTFVYQGQAESVQLLHWVYGLPSQQPFQRLQGTGLWHLHLELPLGSRIEYKLNVRKDGRSEWIQDPLNRLQAHDPFGANSVCRASGYRRPDWTRPDPEACPGRLDEIRLRSRVFSRQERVGVYVPPRFRKTRRYPLLIVHDGDDYLNYSQLQTVLDNLIHRLEVPALIVALTNAGERLNEYAGQDAHAEFLTRELVPRLAKDFPLIGEPSARGLMGASFGAVAALHAAWKAPGYYGRLLLQSGSFAFSDIGKHGHGETFDPVVEFMNRFRRNPGRPSERVFVSCGIYESLIYESRSLIPLLQETGMQVRFQEAPDGHNWENWRDRLRDALSWLFPGPLWMVYE